MEREINISEVIDLVLRRLWIIVTCVTVTTIISFCYSSYLVEPVYTSTGTLYVRNVEEVKDDRVDVSEINASQRLVNTYIEILRSDTFTKIIANDVNLGYTSRQIKGMLSMKSLNGTEILQIDVNSTNPDHAAVIVNSILKNADEEIIRIVKAGSVEIIDNGDIPTEPTSPNIALNTVSGAVIGGIISVLIIILIHIMDVSVRGEEDMADRYEIPVLGVIPTIKNEGN
ncbi:MAG: hypothetical protein IJN62_00225 [Clostridia bacterium]|nr:hypothetical protein [Clostridia bacterium]